MSPLPYDVGRVGTRVYDALEPIAGADASLGYPLLAYASALALPSEEVADLAETGDNGEVGWSAILDIDRIADDGIEWLAQFIGVRLNGDLSPADQRQRVKTTDGWNRGTLGAIAGAAAQYLTGTKRVTIRERFNPGFGADAYHIQVITLTAETPDPAQVEAAILLQKPAGIILHYETMVGQDFQELLDNYPTFDDVFISFATFQGVYTNVPGT